MDLDSPTRASRTHCRCTLDTRDMQQHPSPTAHIRPHLRGTTQLPFAVHNLPRQAQSKSKSKSNSKSNSKTESKTGTHRVIDFGQLPFCSQPHFALQQAVGKPTAPQNNWRRSSATSRT